MYYIVGLGNPGEKYQNTRHNIGWMVLDILVSGAGLPPAVLSARYSGKVSAGQLEQQDVMVLYPDTFMNNSGRAVKKLVPSVETDHLVVLHDDVDLPLGQVRVSFGRGSGGHNGIASIIDKLNTKDFVRVRIGIGKSGFWPWQQGTIKRPGGGGILERFVLGGFGKREQNALNKAKESACAATVMIVTEGHTVAMNKFN